CRRAAIRPIQIEERHARGIELGPTLDETVSTAMPAADSFAGDSVAFAIRRFPHCLKPALNGSKEFSHVDSSLPHSPGGGCQSSTLLPSGSITQPNLPYSESSVFSRTLHPSSRRA